VVAALVEEEEEEDVEGVEEDLGLGPFFAPFAPRVLELLCFDLLAVLSVCD